MLLAHERTFLVMTKIVIVKYLQSSGLPVLSVRVSVNGFGYSSQTDDRQTNLGNSGVRIVSAVIVLDFYRISSGQPQNIVLTELVIFDSFVLLFWFLGTYKMKRTNERKNKTQREYFGSKFGS